MLGHLVFSRYAAENMHPAHRDEAGWLARLMTALRRRLPH